MGEVLLDMRTRLKAAAATAADAKTGYLIALKLRNGLVVQAVDEGMEQQEVARLIGVHKSRVVTILADSQPDVVGE